MARARHARRSGWLGGGLQSGGPAPRWREVHARSLLRLSDEMTALQAEVLGVHGVCEEMTAVDAAGERRTARLEEELTAARAEVAALRRDLDTLRADVLWIFSERRPAADGTPVSRLSVARRSG
jgi:hypothetical protein